MILAIDAGNSRVKWGCFANGDWIATGATSHSEKELLYRAFVEIPAPDKIVISNVAGDEVRRELFELCARFSVRPELIAAERERCGVVNNYTDPTKLGSDRWAALIAARQLQRGPVVVVNAGTALTVDALTQQGEFLGGLIVPGLALMMSALTDGTAHAHAQRGNFASFPVNTLDAIYSGAINAAVGSVERMVALLGAHDGATVRCIVSGGAAAALIPYLPKTTSEVKHLVLQGLVAMAESTT